MLITFFFFFFFKFCVVHVARAAQSWPVCRREAGSVAAASRLLTEMVDLTFYVSSLSSFFFCLFVSLFVFPSQVTGVQGSCSVCTLDIGDQERTSSYKSQTVHRAGCECSLLLQLPSTTLRRPESQSYTLIAATNRSSSIMWLAASSHTDVNSRL